MHLVSPISFIFMQFSAKYSQIIGIWPKLRSWSPPPEKSWICHWFVLYCANEADTVSSWNYREWKWNNNKIKFQILMFQEKNECLSSAKYILFCLCYPVEEYTIFFVRYTATLLIIFKVLLTSKQYYGEPIDCWCPGHFTDSHVSFTNTVCWVNTYLHLCIFLR